MGQTELLKILKDLRKKSDKFHDAKDVVKKLDKKSTSVACRKKAYSHLKKMAITRIIDCQIMVSNRDFSVNHKYRAR